MDETLDASRVRSNRILARWALVVDLLSFPQNRLNVYVRLGLLSLRMPPELECVSASVDLSALILEDHKSDRQNSPLCPSNIHI